MSILFKKQGKNLLPNKATTQTKNGITFTVNEDGSVTLNGTATANAFFNLIGFWESTENFLETGKSYILSGSGNANITIVGSYDAAVVASTAASYKQFINSSGLSCVYLKVNSGVTVDNVTVYPMIRLATETDATYEPYRPGSGTVKSIYANINGEKKEILSVWVNKEGVPTKVYAVNTGRFVAVGYSGNSFYTKNGKTWASMPVVDATVIYGVTFGNGRFVAVGSNGKSYYSLDGENWVAMSGLATNYTFNDVTYGNGRFVTVGEAGRSYYSLDGENWVAMSGLSGVAYQSVTYGNGRFVCVGNKAAYYSLDGVTWAAMSGLPSAIFNGVTFGNGRFVAVGYSGNSCYSVDGQTWNAMSGLPSATFRSVTYGNGRFVAVGDRVAYYSLDSENWVAMSGVSSAYLYGVTYGNGRFVAVGSSSKSFYSIAGETWVAMSGLSGSVEEVCFSVDGGYGDLN